MFQADKDITGYTTFGIPVKCKLFAEYDSLNQLIRIFRSDEFRQNEVLHIGGGSNLLFVDNYEGLILHSAIKGIKIYEKNSEEVYVIAGAGEQWVDLVDFTLDNGLSGLENLSGIPGEVGASPIQNVGAYGVEAGDLIHSVECFDSETGKVVTIKGDDCEFGYRMSKFKKEWKGKYYVLRVSFKLKRSETAHNLTYGPLKNLSTQSGHIPSPREVAEYVTNLRNSKLPQPGIIGSAGSFFKNPVVKSYFFREEILFQHPDVPYYELDNDLVKIPAGWLIEHSGLKGFRIGGAEVWPNQCLVIANTGGASAVDVVNLSNHITDEVNKNFSIHLEPEVNFIESGMRITILGSGTSKGVPEIGCGCSTCRSTDPRDKRLRASVLIETHGLKLLIDPSPDFRQQMLTHNLHNLDAILITHSHYDHVGGLDDVRPLNTDGKMPLYLSSDVNDDLHRRLDYCFREHPYPGVPQFILHEIDNSPFDIDGIRILPIRVYHGQLPILGFRIGNFAYVTDAKSIPEEEMWKLEGLDVLILNALRFKPHFSHLNVEEALGIIERVSPKEAYLTHLCHHLGRHAEIEPTLPENVHLAYDGLTIKIP